MRLSDENKKDDEISHRLFIWNPPLLTRGLLLMESALAYAQASDFSVNWDYQRQFF